MHLLLDEQLALKYKSNSQKARVLTEDWILKNMYCPVCGNNVLIHFINNSPVADFYCEKCSEQYELKSINGRIGSKITDGAYQTFINRIQSSSNPNFLFMSYSMTQMTVQHLCFVPKFFFVPEMVEKRKALGDHAKRAGWIGCNILFDHIPSQGKINIVHNGNIIDPNVVKQQVESAIKIRMDNLTARGWLLDVLDCVNRIKNDVFTLQEVYQYEKILAKKYRNNQNIKAKIRQQLQVLRDKEMIKFCGNGLYCKRF